MKPSRSTEKHRKSSLPLRAVEVEQYFDPHFRPADLADDYANLRDMLLTEIETDGVRWQTRLPLWG